MVTPDGSLLLGMPWTSDVGGPPEAPKSPGTTARPWHGSTLGKKPDSCPLGAEPIGITLRHLIYLITASASSIGFGVFEGLERPAAVSSTGLLRPFMAQLLLVRARASLILLLDNYMLFLGYVRYKAVSGPARHYSQPSSIWGLVQLQMSLAAIIVPWGLRLICCHS